MWEVWQNICSSLKQDLALIRKVFSFLQENKNVNWKYISSIPDVLLKCCWSDLTRGGSLSLTAKDIFVDWLLSIDFHLIRKLAYREKALSVALRLVNLIVCRDEDDDNYDYKDDMMMREMD